jgi:PQQ-dependent catabolism-associated CXXCW motif protein
MGILRRQAWPTLTCLALLLFALRVQAEIAEPDGYRMDHYRGPVPATIRGGTVVHVAALPALIAAQHPLLIDVLPAPAPPPEQRADLPRMPLAHNDIPGSIWLPEVGRGALSPQTETWFRAQLARLTHGDLERPMVFYCLSNCWMSWNATRRAIGYGYKHALWFPEGADGWQAAGNITQTAVPTK